MSASKPFLPVLRDLPLLQAVVIFVVADGFIFCFNIVLSLASITVSTRVFEKGVCGGVRELFGRHIFRQIRYHDAADNRDDVSGGGIGDGSFILHVPFVCSVDRTTTLITLIGGN